MFKYKVFGVFCVSVLIQIHVFAGGYDSTIFVLPMDEPVDLSANFAELRQNHFHGGLDFRMGGAEGKPIYCVADGYVSGIRIDSKGYGLQLYVTHSNGYVSSYAHLLRFNDVITEYIQNYQISKQQNLLNIKVPPMALVVKQRDILGLGGNTGSSRGPHLHFECMEPESGKIVNPLRFYPQIKDGRKPIINNVKVYPLDEYSTVNANNKDVIYVASRRSANTDYGIIQPLTVWGNIGFSIQATDYMNNFAHVFGIYKVQLYKDSILVYEHMMDKIEPWEQRSINSFVDYPHFVKTKNFFQKTFIEPNNKLGIYSVINNKRGVIEFVQEGTHKMKFVLSDYHGNSTAIRFTVSVKRPAQFPKKEYVGLLYEYNKVNTYRSYGLRVVFGKNTLFDNLYFMYSIDSTTKHPKAYSPIFKISDPAIALKDTAQISIKVTKPIEKNLQSKLLIAQYLGPNSTSPIGGRYDSGYVTAPIKFFAKYIVIIDTLPPGVQPMKVYDRANLSAISGMFFKIWDGHSGISRFDLWIDGKWSIMYFDSKTNIINHRFNPARMEYGRWHDARLVVKDNKDNEKVLEFTFYK